MTKVSVPNNIINSSKHNVAMLHSVHKAVRVACYVVSVIPMSTVLY